MVESGSISINEDKLAYLREQGKVLLLDALEAHAKELGFDQSLWIERLKVCAGQTYDEFSGLKARSSFDSLVGLTASSISLVHEDELSFSLELANLVRKLREVCDSELSELHRRYLVLFDQEDMPLEQCPVGPDVVVKALRALIESVGLEPGERHGVLEHGVTPLGTRLRALYVALNRSFDEAGIRPRQILRSAVDGRGQRGVVAAHESVQVFAQDQLSGDCIATLQARLLRGRKNGTTVGVELDPELAAAIRERVSSWLEQRQGAGDADMVRLAGSELVPLLPPATAAAVEAVEKIFSAIAGFEDVGRVARDLIAQLQIPFLRLALLDDKLLSEASHPARLLLDNVASIVVTLPPDDRQHRVISQLQDVIMGLQRKEASGAEAFARAQGALDHLVTDLQRRHKSLTRASIDAFERAERRETAMVQASATVDEFSERHLPPAVRAFIERWWVQVLARNIYSHGPDDEATLDAIELSRSLVNAFSEHAAPRGEIDAMIAVGLTRGLVGLLGLDSQASTQVLGPVIGALAEGRNGLSATSELAESPVVPTISEISGTRPLSLLHHPGYAVIKGGTHPAASAVVGNWLSLDVSDGTCFVGCVTVVSPEKRVLLLVDAAGSCALAVSRRAIVDLALQGKCRLIDQQSITERAAMSLLSAPAY